MRRGLHLINQIESAWHIGYLAVPFEVNHNLNLDINITHGFMIMDGECVMDSFESLMKQFEDYAILYTDGSKAKIEGR